jgi:hypothetical protein
MKPHKKVEEGFDVKPLLGNPTPYGGASNLPGAPDPFSGYLDKLPGAPKWGLDYAGDETKFKGAVDTQTRNYLPKLPGAPDQILGGPAGLPGAPEFVAVNKQPLPAAPEPLSTNRESQLPAAPESPSTNRESQLPAAPDSRPAILPPPPGLPEVASAAISAYPEAPPVHQYQPAPHRDYHVAAGVTYHKAHWM